MKTNNVNVVNLYKDEHGKDYFLKYEANGYLGLSIGDDIVVKIVDDIDEFKWNAYITEIVGDKVYIHVY